MPISRRLPPEHPRGIRRVQVGRPPNHGRPDWWTIDLHEAPGVDEAMDPTRPWHWSDHLDLIYAEHFIEHLPIEQAAAFLAHAGDALRVGGRLRLSTPSLEWVMKSHFSFAPADLQARLLDTFLINRAFHGWGHRFLYSKEMLRELLLQVGFEQIVFHGYGQSFVPELQAIEQHPTGPGADGYPDVWIVEAARGERRPSVSEWLGAWLHDTYTKYGSGRH